MIWMLWSVSSRARRSLRVCSTLMRKRRGALPCASEILLVSRAYNTITCLTHHDSTASLKPYTLLHVPDRVLDHAARNVWSALSKQTNVACCTAEDRTVDVDCVGSLEDLQRCMSSILRPF